MERCKLESTRGKGCGGKGQGRGRRLAEGKGLEVGISGINADSRKGGNVAISPNGEQICNQTNLRYWEYLIPLLMSRAISCHVLVNRIGASDIHHRPGE